MSPREIGWHRTCIFRREMQTPSRTLRTIADRPLRDRVSSGLARVAHRLGNTPLSDVEVERDVQRRLKDDRIEARVEHGCVVLSGAVPTEERASIVRSVARVPGVDSVVDLMNERREVTEAAMLVPPSRSPSSARRRLAVAAAGLGLAIAGLSLRSRGGLSLAAFGIVALAYGVRRPSALAPRAVW